MFSRLFRTFDASPNTYGIWLTIWCLSSLFISFPQAGYAEPAKAQNSILDVSAYTHIQALRRQIALTNRDLAAMGCNQEDATRVLTQLRAWYLANRTSLDQLRNEHFQKIRELGDVMRRVHRGEVDGAAVEQQVAELRQAITSKQQQQFRLIDTAATHIAASMSPEQNQTWKLIRSFPKADTPTPSQTVSGMDQKSHSIQMALSDQQKRLSVQSQQQALDESNQRVGKYLEAVISAEATVLPMPIELKSLNDFSTPQDRP